MGAFFLFKSDMPINMKEVMETFANKGFNEHQVFILKRMTLILFKKQLVSEDNFCVGEKGSSLYATGTVVYKGKSYRESLIALMLDFESEKLDYKELIGSFCLIFCKNDNIRVLTDASNIYHVYTTTEDNTILSSSFLAITAALTHKLSLNHMELMELLIMGYAIGNKTVLKDIVLVDDIYKKQAKKRYFSFLTFPASSYVEERKFENFYDCVDRQLALLLHYYNSIRPLAMKYGVDIGLSGGYDSRLNLLLAISASMDVTVHTHLSNVHLKESRIAKQIADEIEMPIKSVPLRYPSDMSEDELIRNLEDSIHFFDGHCNRTMGTFNDVHTKSYRTAVLGRNRLGLNGLGGELYRNYNYSYCRKIDFVEWVKYHILTPYSCSAIRGRHNCSEFVEHVLLKSVDILRIRRSRYIDNLIARRFFADIVLPYSSAIKSNAENQLAFFLMPFTEYGITREALRATPYVGMTARFEMEMIRKLNSKIASIPSSYGYRLDKEPLSAILKSRAKCYIPERMKNIILSCKTKYSKQVYDITPFLRHKSIRQFINILNATKLPIAWDELFSQKAAFERSIFIGYFLYKYSHKIAID